MREQSTKGEDRHGWRDQVNMRRKHNNGHHGQTRFVRAVNRSKRTQMKMDHCCVSRQFFFVLGKQITFVVANKKEENLWHEAEKRQKGSEVMLAMHGMLESHWVRWWNIWTGGIMVKMEERLKERARGRWVERDYFVIPIHALHLHASPGYHSLIPLSPPKCPNPNLQMRYMCQHHRLRHYRKRWFWGLYWK